MFDRIPVQLEGETRRLVVSALEGPTEGRHGRVVPLEVKSGRKVRAHAALDRLLAH